MKYILPLALVLSPFFLAAQDIVFLKAIELKRTLSENREAYPVVNEVDKNVALFLLDKKSIQALHFDSNFNLIESLFANKPEDKFTELLGNNISDGNYNLFFSTGSNDAFACVQFNFTTQIFQQNLINLTIKKELYIGSISYRNKFYFITIPKNSSVIKLYIFDNNFHYVVKTFDFQDHHFTPDESYYKLSDALRHIKVEIIDNEIPNALNITSSPAKLYYYGESIVLTTNIGTLKTAIISIDINTLESSLQVYPFPSTTCEPIDFSVNSYIHANKLYQLEFCYSEMGLSIIDLMTGRTIKEFNANENEEIPFRNSPMVKESNGLYGENGITFTKTKQFLRKASVMRPAINVFPTESSLELTLGGCASVQNGSAGGTMGGVTNTLYGPIPSAYNPRFSNSNFVCTYFKSLIDAATYEHKAGIIQKNTFDKINELKESLDSNIAASTVFRQNGFLFFAYYVKDTDRYIIRKFK